VRAFYDDRERQELARLDSCEVIESPMAREVTYSRSVALAHVAELLDELMPDREASDAVFRLSLAVIEELRGSALWMPLTYFELWMTRLMGFLPELTECIVCGRSLNVDRNADRNSSRAFWHVLADGLTCLDDKRIASSELSPEARAVAAQMLRSRVSEFAGIDWPKALCADLRKFLIRILERHIERKLVTAGMLEKIG
jgi:DNA repair protein RecO (recombination protein O)